MGKGTGKSTGLDLARSGPFIGLAGMATTLFLYGYSAVVRHDLESLVVLPLVWVVLFVLTLVWFGSRPYVVMALPILAAGAWFWAMLT